jgi:hypothetical protein
MAKNEKSDKRNNDKTTSKQTSGKYPHCWCVEKEAASNNNHKQND